MPHRSTDVYRFLIFLQKYLLGDLELFHQLSKDAERKESKVENLKSNNGCFKFFARLRRPITTTSTTITTTQYPYAFVFMFGDPVVSRMTIPITATLFSTIDVLGFFTRTGNDYGSTSNNFAEFFSNPSTHIHSTELDVLIKVYRHGMTHNYLPKLNVEISYHSKNPVGKLFFKNTSGNLVLNVNRLEELVVNRLDEIINDASIYTNMNAQLLTMTTDYATKSSSSIATLLGTL